jgi:hypothetical protein
MEDIFTLENVTVSSTHNIATTTNYVMDALLFD